jgi:hypothetical protein
MTALADDLVPDELWALVEPLLPVPPRRSGPEHQAATSAATSCPATAAAATPPACWPRPLWSTSSSGLDQVLVTCAVDKLGSRRVIEANGGVLDRIVEGEARYCARLPSRAPEQGGSADVSA